jgi:hypothetical protein
MAVARDETTVDPCWASAAAATYRSGRTSTNPTGWVSNQDLSFPVGSPITVTS